MCPPSEHLTEKIRIKRHGFMRLRKLLEDIPHQWIGPDIDPDINGISSDSREVSAGHVFVALKGQKHNGHDHAESVVKKGVTAVVSEKAMDLSVPVIVVHSTLACLSSLSARFYGNPSENMTIVGITGTNGKTTITYLLESIFRQAGLFSGVIGTVDYRWLDKKEKAINTTPLAGDVQRLLARMRTEHVTHVAMEVSSHALNLHRVDDVCFQTAVFTNLTRDHLDYHQDMESYFKAKAKLFKLLQESPQKKKKCAVVNLDDEWSEKLKDMINYQALTYGLSSPADVMASDMSLGAEGSCFVIHTPQGNRTCQLHLVGKHNVYNALAATGVAVSLGIPMDIVIDGLQSLRGVPGRLESMALGQSKTPFSVFVDYAHTDDALKNVLQALRPLTKNRLITVFGCGGDRDRTKRPLMGEVAMTFSHYVIVTSDNPRTEDPQKIALDVEVGIRRFGGRHYDIVLDREEAIVKALSMAQSGDVVLIAGKGHETYQIFKDKTIDFDDREVVRKELAKLEMGI